MTKHGVRKELIEDQQAKILAERVATCGKKPTLAEVYHAFGALFRQDYDFDFETENNIFCDAMVVSSKLKQLQREFDIHELKDFVNEAVATSSAAAGEGPGRKASKLGSALTMHPKGRLFFHEVWSFKPKEQISTRNNRSKLSTTRSATQPQS